MLLVKVTGYLHELVHLVKVHASMGNPVHDLVDTDIKVGCPGSENR